MTDLLLTVKDIKAETAAITCFCLVRADGAALPDFAAGSHITIAIPGVGPRKYSLVHAEPIVSDVIAPTSYVIAVRLEVAGGGGSRYMHALKVGQTLQVSPPQSNFPIESGAAPVALIAGGVGVTPLLTMAAALKGAGRPFRMVYAARSQHDLAFREALERLAGSDLTVHLDDVAGRLFDIEAYFRSLPEAARVYMCGPKPMLKAGMAAAKRLGWPRDRLTFELFYSVAPARDVAVATPVPPPLPRVTDGSFEVVVKSSGQCFRIPAEKSILDVLIDAGVDPIHDCKRGECGVCQVGVIEGIPDHKDHILSDSERAENKVMHVCISRSKTPRLVLDL